jgi:hypothetical protein
MTAAANTHVHPAFAGVLNGFAAIPKLTAEPLLTPELIYRQALAEFDWHFEFSDDHTVWGNGSNSLARLHRMQKKIDPDGRIWNEHRPDMPGVPLPHVAGAA